MSPLYRLLDQSYLGDIFLYLAVEISTTAGEQLNCGIPQGSVLRPRKYCLYSEPVGEKCSRHTLLYRCYADDAKVDLAVIKTTKIVSRLKETRNKNPRKESSLSSGHLHKVIQLRIGEKTACVTP